MAKYKIYHIPNVKIGMSMRVKERLRDQGYTLDDAEILEEYDDMDFAAVRELELQREYGYKVDTARYNYERYLPGSKSWKGKKHTKETRKKISNGIQGTKHKTDGARNRMIQRNKNLIGSSNHKTKLTAKEVLEIRSKYIPRQYSIAKLAKEYGVSTRNIKCILARLTWKHI